MLIYQSCLLIATAGVVLWQLTYSPTDQAKVVAPTSVSAMGQLLNNTETFGFPDVEDTLWFNDQPQHMIVDRVHGGITPGAGSLPAGN